MMVVEPHASTRTVRYTQGTGKAHASYLGAEKFKEVLEAGSNGQISVEIYPDGQFADEANSIQLMRSGALEFGNFSSSLVASALKVPELQAWSLPFLYDDAQSAYRAWASDVAKDSYAALEKSGIKWLGCFDQGFRQLSTSQAVNKVEDLQGLKVRTPNGEVYVNTWKALGAVPGPMAFGELYSALQTGAMDATELPIQVVASGKFYEVQKSVALINYLNDPNCISVSTKFFESLSPELQKAVEDAADAAVKAQHDASVESFETSLKEVTDAGLTVTTPDLEPFRDAVASVYESFYASTGDDGRKLVESIRQAAKE